MENDSSLKHSLEIQDSDEKKNIKFLHNPLPGPKPHVKREMKYDYEVPPEQMHFDIDKPSNNSYDIN